MNLHSEIRSKVKNLPGAIRKASPEISLADGESEPKTAALPPADVLRKLADHIARQTDEVLVTVAEHRGDEHAHITVTVSKVAA